jgi:hypothetical protein
MKSKKPPASAAASLSGKANHSPQAADHITATTEEAGSVAVDVLANDTDLDGDSLTVTAIGGSPLGLVTITGGGTGISYDDNDAPQSSREQHRPRQCERHLHVHDYRLTRGHRHRDRDGRGVG